MNCEEGVICSNIRNRYCVQIGSIKYFLFGTEDCIVMQVHILQNKDRNGGMKFAMEGETVDSLYGSLKCAENGYFTANGISSFHSTVKQLKSFSFALRCLLASARFHIRHFLAITALGSPSLHRSPFFRASLRGNRPPVNIILKCHSLTGPILSQL